ncbi:MAG: protein-disulfide reductase DsbD family protein [Verrucomicrobiales bacterium]
MSRRRLTRFVLAVLLSGIGTIGAFAQKKTGLALADALGGEEKVVVSLVSEARVVEAGKPFMVGLSMEHAEGVHSYWLNPGTGLKTNVEWELPGGWESGPLLWALPEAKMDALGYSHIYTGSVLHLTEITPPATFTAGAEATLKAAVSWLQCDAAGCTPGKANLDLKIKSAAAAETDPRTKAAFDVVRSQQPRSSDAWKVAASDSGAEFVITLTPGTGASTDPGEIYFFDRNAAVKNEPPQIEKSASAWTLKVPREETTTNKSSEGFLFASKGWLADGTLPALAVPLAPSSAAPATAASEKAEPAPIANKEGSVSSKIPATTLEAMDEIIPKTGPKHVGLGGEARAPLTYWWAMLLAFVGGFILNAMPCVFPVLGIKVLGFVSQSGHDSRKIRNHGLIFTLGLLVSLWILAGVLIALNEAGQRLGWGFQQQSAPFTMFIIALLFLFGLNLAGVFEMGTSLTGVGGGLMSKEGYAGSFFTGVLTTLIATPCSGPFLGAAMGYTLQQPPLPALVLFTAFGLGISLPYLVLSLQPALVNRLPRPGAWMETFKMVMAFPMFGTVIYFLWSFGGQVGAGGLVDALVALLLLAVAAWIYGRYGTLLRPKRQRFTAMMTALAILALAVWRGAAATRNQAESVVLEKEIASLNEQITELVESGGKFSVKSSSAPNEPEFTWENWSPERVRDLRREGRILFADFTAKW